jgi:pimeloyl-ACP methyl ester carboxylesterase
VAELLGSPDEFPERYAFADPCSLEATAPRVLLHGTVDDIVPIEHSRRYAVRQRAELVEVEGAGHFELIDPRSESFRAVREKIEDHRAG